MKKLMWTIFAMVLGTCGVCAQQEEQQDTTQVEATDGHLQFEGVSISGTIDDFVERAKPRFKLKKKMGGDRKFIFEGPVLGYNTYFEVNYTRKSRTVYRVLVTPKAINEQTWIDSLSTRFGEPQDTDKGLLWQTPDGMVLFYTPQGYDPALIYLDFKGNTAFKEEK